jgi:hypothetical protein
MNSALTSLAISWSIPQRAKSLPLGVLRLEAHGPHVGGTRSAPRHAHRVGE